MKLINKPPSHCAQAFATDHAIPLARILISINRLRHCAVHRLPTTAKGILEMIRSATRFARALRDSPREKQLHELHGELEGKIRALELNKNYLEKRLEREVERIAKQRRELDEKEKETVGTILREDKYYGSLIGGLLSQSVERILDDRENDELEATGAEPSSDR